MPKYRLTTLSPIHISSGEEYELNYNLLEKDGFIYIYDEFRLVEYFIAHDIAVPSNINEIKRLIAEKSDAIIASNLHRRKIESSFSKIDKPLLENISTAENPIVTGSSIKGSLRTAILDCMTNNQEHCKDIIKNFKDKSFDEKRFNKRFDSDLAEIFKYLKVTDSLLPLETKVYKTINLKKDKNHQATRTSKVENIANFVEAIKPNQSFEIEINDMNEEQIFKNLAWLCNKFYIPFFANDTKQYFAKKTDSVEKTKNADKNMFIINVGRFGGAESKSLNNIRYIKASKANDKSTTSARTFALEKNVNDTTYFEQEILPFGWIMCEKIEKFESMKNNRSKELREKKFDAIDNLRKIQKKKEIEIQQKIEQKKQQEQEELQKAQEEKAAQEAQLAAMSPLERKIEELKNANQNPNDTDDVIIFQNIKNGNLDEYKCEALELLKGLMKKNGKWNENKPKKKTHARTMEVIKMQKDCN